MLIWKKKEKNDVSGPDLKPIVRKSLPLWIPMFQINLSSTLKEYYLTTKYENKQLINE